MEKHIKNYLPLYLTAEGLEIISTNPDWPEYSNEEFRRGYLTGITAAQDDDCVEVQFHNGIHADEHASYVPYSEMKPLLRPLTDLRDDEAQEILIDVLNVPAHSAWMDVEALQQFLCNNTSFTIAGGEEDEEKPLAHFEFTPYSFMLLTKWLTDHHFDVYDLIEPGLAINKTTWNIQA